MEKDYKKEIKPSFTPLTVMEEASRCLLCLDAPCSKACPASTDPAKFIRSLRFKNVKGAAETIRNNNPLGGICARVCPTERYCQLGCSRCGIDKPIDIGRIQRYITDYEDSLKMPILEVGKATNKKVAIIGSGPAGLASAALLRKAGHQVSIFEKEAKLGGYLRYGIPEYRLPNAIVDKEVQRILDLGVDVHTNTYINNENFEKLKKEYDAVLLAIGNAKGKTLPLFENKENVVIAVDLLKNIKENYENISLPDNVLVIGGGDVAMDTVTSLKRLGVQYVTDVVYETFSEFRASKEELEGAREEGVTIIDGYVPTSVDGNVVTFKHRFIDSEIKIKADLIVLAVGQFTDLGDIDLPLEKGEINYPGNRVTNSNVFFDGDIGHYEKTVVYAVRTAKEVAFMINKFLSK